MVHRNSKGKIACWCAVFIGLSITVSCQSQEVVLLADSKIKLAPPIIQVDSPLFQKSALADVHLRQAGTTLRYTLDGSEVSSNSMTYQSQITINKTLQLKAKAFHPDFQPSETASIATRKIRKDLRTAQIEIQPSPHKTYRASGNKTLIDGQKGGINFRNGNDWLGFQAPEISVTLNFEKPVAVSKVIISILNDQDSWIFLPRTLTVVSEGNTLGSTTLENCDKKALKRADFVEVEITPNLYSVLQLKIAAMEGIPDWHAGKETRPWTFVDEILIE